MYCSNCGKNGHIFKFCSEPITSYGVILIKFKSDNYKKLVTKLDIKNNEFGVSLENENDINIFYLIKNHIQFLLIRRKYTLGYLEFIRGRYNLENIDAIIHLFRQMTKDEIDKIKNNDFDHLWKKVYGKNSKKE